MVRLVKISKEQLPLLVLIAYYGDKDLLNEYHVEKLTLDEAVDSTLEMVDISENEMELTFFMVKYNGEKIGYVITSGNHLYSFGIAIKFRRKEILKEWWERLRVILGSTFTCLLFSNNTRAINYLIKRGMKIEWQNTEHEKLNEVFLKY